MSSGISKHFKREAIFMVSFPIVLILIALIAGIFGSKIMHYQAVKKCRQSGGTYEPEKLECVIPNRKMSETIK